MGGHDHHHPSVPEPPYAKYLANKSHYCPPDFHYSREIYAPYGGYFNDPKGWRTNTAIATLVMLAGAYAVFCFGNAREERLRAPKGWIPSQLWNDNVPTPVDYRGKVLKDE
uniref:KFYI n=1 Tax=Polytomella sp. Pringsheim 198.80 TaxID=37502 RepID=UPI001E1E2449|nr:Chain c, KFYI [Polytomella sp. Pringsheim 198.80]7ARD_c Chain c, KFYI [Polytomella sp. Pringsheim 198.80]